MNSNRLVLKILTVFALTFVNLASSVTAITQSATAAGTVNQFNVPDQHRAINAGTLATDSFRINAGQSRFMAIVGSGGLLWFMGHTHHFAVRDFSGEITLTPGSLTPASLQLTIQAASLEETGKDFTEQQKQIINKEAHTQVLEVALYPQIIFKSTSVSGNMTEAGQYKVKIVGDLTLHGVTRSVEIPTRVTVSGNTLKASGGFSVNRSDYKVKAKSIKGGTIRVRNKVTFEFEITATR
jgi:polyisoprenoid-binding protein YceI